MSSISKVNSSRKFFTQLFIFLLTVFAADFALGHLIKKAYFKQSSGEDYLTTYAVEKSDADIVIFGSSRAVNLFNTTILTDKTGLSCFNAGRDGEPLFYHLAVLKAVLKRYTPKIVLLSVDAGNFSKGIDAYDRLSVLLPYYADHPEIRPVVALKGHTEKLKMYSKIYPYNSLILPIIAGNTGYNKKKYPHSNGFIPLKNVFRGPLKTFDYSAEQDLDTVKINAYRSFLQDCKTAGVQLHVVCPPYMIQAIGVDSSITTARQIAQESGISFWDYSSDSFFTEKPHLFADYRHLNEDGVVFFSNMITTKLQAHMTPDAAMK